MHSLILKTFMWPHMCTCMYTCISYMMYIIIHIYMHTWCMCECVYMCTLPCSIYIHVPREASLTTYKTYFITREASLNYSSFIQLCVYTALLQYAYITHAHTHNLHLHLLTSLIINKCQSLILHESININKWWINMKCSI